MVTKIEYENFLLKNGISVYITNENGQRWELKRVGISSAEMQKLVKEIGKTEACKKLINDKKLIPIFGGELNF